MRIRVPDNLKIIASIFQENHFECYLVGGGVRDQLLGLKAKDYDLATNARPEDVIRLFRRVIPTGIKHGTVSVLFKGGQYEVTTYRIDGKYSDGRRPDTIEFTGSIEEDLKRRDFTINAIAYDIFNNRILDPNDGQSDLKKRIIRAIGNASERLNEDSLRAVRACRFASQLGFEVEKETLEAIKKTAPRIPALSKERIYEELIKIVKTKQPSTAIRLLHETGLLIQILPELEACAGVEQKGRHRYDVFEHCLIACDAVPLEYSKIRIAALLHDIGKPAAKRIDEEGTPTFYSHEKISADMAENIMLKYRFPKNDLKYIKHLIKNHMFNYTPDWTDSAVRRFISRVKKEYISDLFILRHADSYAHDSQWHYIPLLDELRDRVDSILEKEHAVTIKDLHINGNILSKEGLIPPGPFMGRIMDFLLEAVLEDPCLNEKDTLLKMAVNFYKEYH